MKTVAALALLLVSADAFTPPMMATRAVGSPKKVAKKVTKTAEKAAIKVPSFFGSVAKSASKPAKKVAAKAPKAVAKAPKKVVKTAKKVVAKAPVGTKPPPESKGYPSFRDAAESFKLGNISGGGNKQITPVFIHPTVNTEPAPSFDYKELAKLRQSKTAEFAYDDGLTELERRQRGALPAFLTGSAKSQADISAIRDDIELQEYPFGLSADRFQLLFITAFGLFTLVGSLSGSVKLD